MKQETGETKKKRNELKRKTSSKRISGKTRFQNIEVQGKNKREAFRNGNNNSEQEKKEEKKVA